MKTPSRRLIIFITLLLTFGILLSACQPAAETTAEPEPEAQTTVEEAEVAEEAGDISTPLDPPEKVTVAYVPIMKFAAMYVAQERGLFEKYGLDVEINSVSSGTEAIAFLSEGQIDVGGIAIVTSLWNGWNQGLDIRIIAPGALEPFENSPTKFIVSKELFDSGEVTSVADLEGLVVALAGGPGSGGEYLLSKALERGGLTIRDVEVQQIGNPDMPAAFENGSIAAGLLGSPFADQVIQGGFGVELEGDLSPGQMTVAFVGSGNFVNERPEVAQKFVLALTEAARLMQGETYLDDENVAAYLGYVKSTEEAIRTGRAVIYDPNMAIPVDGLSDVEATHRSNGRTEYDDPINLSNVVDTSFAETAVDFLGEAELVEPVTEVLASVATLAPLDPPEQVSVAYVPIMKFAAMYVAQERGLFEKYGLDVEINSVSSGTEAIAFLSEGQIDVGGIAIVTSLWNGWNQGLDIRIIAPGALEPFENSPTKFIVSKELFDSGEVTSVADLEGLVVALAGGPGSGGEYLLSKALERGGLTIRDVEVQQIGNPDMPAAFENGSIAAGLLGSPFADQVIQGGFGVELEGDLSPGQMTVAFVGSGNFVNERPEVAERFVLALAEATRLMQGDDYLDDENIAAYLSFVNSTEDAIKDGRPVIYDPDMNIPVDGLADVEATHRSNGRTEYEEAIDLANIVITSFVEQAIEILGAYSK